ncbi:Uncharacterized protein Rs2_09963 [Raphanus sativus]|nr:Uncharacterized protein Rs2_09963 [Raphanus sativus]
MKQTPDLSAILKGRLKSLSKKKSVSATDNESADVQGDDPSRVATPVTNDDGSAAAGTEMGEEEKNDPLVGESTHPEDEPSEAPDEMAQQKSSKKKKGKKRSRETPSGKEVEGSNASREDPVEPAGKDLSEERLNKKRKEPAVETEQSFSRQENLPTEGVTPDDPVDSFMCNEREGDKFDSAPDASVSKQKRLSKKKATVSRSAPPPNEGASGNVTVNGLQMNFPDLVDFSYNENTLLISNPLKCAELTRQVRGGPTALPPIDKLFFKDEYVEAAHIRKLVTPSPAKPFLD